VVALLPSIAADQPPCRSARPSSCPVMAFEFLDTTGSAGATEELERIIGQIRERWPHTRIILRADSGFAREGLMGWCEAHAIHYVFGMARNKRLQRAIGVELHEAQQLCAASGGVNDASRS
jgi:hypothetical protein